MLLAFYLKSQIIISNSYFPVKGDSLKFYTDDSPADYDLSVQGGNQNWDFTSLVNKNPSFRAFADAKICDVDKKFTDAELCETTNGFSVFYNVKANVFEKIGEQGEFNQGLPIPNATRYSPAQIERRAPLKFFDFNNSKYNQNFSFSTAFLPDSLLGTLGGLLDSIRFKIAGERIDLVDGWGTCKIPGGTFNVLREKRTEVRDTKIEVHTAFGWLDVSTFLGGGGGGGLTDLIGKDTVVTYNFFSDQAKEEIAVVTVDNNTLKPTEVKFKAIGSPTATQNTLYALPDIKVYPNPLMGNANIYFHNFNDGKYTVEFISAVTGQKVHTKMAIQSSNTVMDFNALDLPKGLIICKVYSEKGAVVTMRKIISL